MRTNIVLDDELVRDAWNGNKVYLLVNLMAHNLVRALQIRRPQRARNTTAKRPPLWRFVRLDTLRKTFIQRAGRLIRPQGKLTLSMAHNTQVKSDLLFYLKDRQATA